MANSNLDLQLKISADNQAGPEVAKLTAQIDQLTAELAAQQGAVREGGKDWLDYAQQVTLTADSMVNIVSTVEDVLIKTAEIGTAVLIYQKWKTLVAGVEASYLTLKTAMESAVIGGTALANAGWDSTRVAADKLEVTVAKLAARFAGFAKIGEALSLAGAALAIAQVGISANESNEKTRQLIEQIGGLTTSLQQLDPQSRAVLIAKERFEELYKASLALGVSADDLVPQFKAFFDQTQSGSLSIKKSADILTDLAKTHVALRSTTREVALSQEALSAAFDTGFTSVSRLGEIFGAALNPALDAVAKQMGVSRTQLQQLIDTGRLGSENILPALAAAANNVTKPLQSAGDAAVFSKIQFEKMGLSFYDLSTSQLPGVDFALQHTAKEIALTADSAVDPIGAAVERIVNFGASVEDWARRVKLALSEAFTTGDWSKDWSNGLKEAMYGLDYLLVGLKEEFKATGESLGILAGAAVTATNPVDDLSAVWSGMSDRLITTRDRLNEYVNALEGVDNAEGRTAEATAAATEALKKLKDVPIPEALQALIDKLDSATTASQAVSKVWQELGALDLTGNNLRSLTVLMETIDQVSKKTKDATGTQIAFSQQLAEIPTTALVGLLNKVQELGPLLEASGNNGVLMGTVLGAVFEKLGLDADEAGGKATQYGKDAAAAFAALAASAKTSGTQVQAALEAALNGAKTQADIDLIIAEFNKLAKAGAFSAQLIADGQAAIARSMEDLARKIPGVADGFKTLGVESAAHLQALATSAELSFKQIKASATPLELRSGFLAWAEAAIKAANATDAVVPSAVRNQAAALGLSTALEELILKLKAVNPEYEALKLQLSRVTDFYEAENAEADKNAAIKQVQIDASIELAKAKGDEARAATLLAEKSAQTIKDGQNEIARNKERVSVLDQVINKLYAEAQLKGMTPEQQKYMQGLMDEANERKRTIATIEAKLPLMERERQQAEIMAGPIGELTRLYADQAKEHERAADASERYQNAQTQEAENALKLAQIKGDEQAIDQAQTALNEQKIAQAQALADARAVEATDAENALSAKALELAADGELSQADQKQLKDMEAAAVGKREVANAAQQTVDQLGKEADATKKASEEHQKATSSADGLSAKLGQITQSARANMGALSEQAKVYFDMMTGISAGQYGIISGFDRASEASSAFNAAMSDGEKEMVKFRSEITAANAAIKSADNSLSHSTGSLGVYLDSLAKASAQTTKAFYEQKLAAKELELSITGMAEKGTLTMSSLQIATRRAGNEFSLLDEEDLSGLTSALDEANQKLREMQQEAQDAQARLAELNAEIAAEKGDTATADRLKLELDQQQQIAEVEAQLAQARAQNNRELIALYEEQKQKLQELYDLKSRNLEKDIKSREEQERAAKTQTQTTASSSGGSGSGSSSGKTYNLNLNAGGKTLNAVTNTDPGAWLDDLERARRGAA